VLGAVALYPLLDPMGSGAASLVATNERAQRPASDQALERPRATAGSDAAADTDAARQPSDVAPDAPDEPGESYDPWDFGVIGTVRVAGRPDFVFEDAQVSVFDGARDREEDALEIDGNFGMYGLHPGEWEVVVSVPQIGTAELTAVLTHEAPVSELSFELPLPRQVEVHVRWEQTFQGLLSGGQKLILIAHRGPEPDAQVKREELDTVREVMVERRHVRFRKHWQETLVLGTERTEQLALFLDEYLVATRPLGANETKVEWLLPDAVWPPAASILRITTIDARSREPVPAFVQPLRWGEKSRSQQAPGVTEIFDLTPGWHVLNVSADGYGRVFRRVFVPAGSETEVTLEMEPGFLLEGVILDQDDLPLNMPVVAYRRGADGTLDDVPMYADAHAAGGFTFGLMPPGEYALRTVLPHEFAQENVRYAHGIERAAALTRVDLNAATRVMLRATAVGWLVLDPIFDPPGSVRYVVRDAAERIVREGRVYTSASKELALAQGTYSVRVEDANGPVGSFVVELGKDPVRVRF